MMAPVGHDNTENNWGCKMVTAPSKIPAKSTEEFKHLVAASIPGFHLMGLYGSGSNANATAINCATGPHGHTEDCLIGCGSYVSATFEEGDLSYLSTNDPGELNYALSMIGADKTKLDERAKNQIIALPYCIPPSASPSSLEMEQWNAQMNWLEQKVSRVASSSISFAMHKIHHKQYYLSTNTPCLAAPDPQSSCHKAPCCRS